MPLTPVGAPCPPHPATELPQGGGGPPGKVGGGVGGGLRARGPAAAAAGAGSGGRVSVARGARNAGPVVSFVRGRGRGHGAAAACEAALREAGAAGAGVMVGVTAAPRGARAARVVLGPWGRALALREAGQAGEGASFRWGGGAVPLVGAGFFAGRVWPFGGHRWCHGGIVRFCLVRRGSGKAACPVSVRCVRGLCWVGGMWWWGWHVVRVEW